ncbi:MAG TPA: S41 family peptidase [Terriglobia bacterium]|nr:S41 family peptidase [Terriglobia bacterium]
MNILDTVESSYATEVATEKAVYGAIDGMLRTLDPHSKFFDPVAFNSLREDQHGKYFGLGITVTTRFGKVTVVSPPFPKSPAEKAGLRVGDVISLVDGQSTKGLELNDVVSKLKGPRGTYVEIQVTRPGVEKPIAMSIMRDEIAKFTINNSFMIKPGVGYIKLESFADTTGQELRDALRKLDARNLDALVFDLRGNPGGLLNEAIEVSETFLQPRQLILRTSGRTRNSAQEYAARKANTENTFPLIVLINKSSASASEIVSGAIQDHDRGLIVGETSFGKGLVQSVYPLGKKQDAGLALTTQKWYTPSGRLIQRDYSQISQFDYYNHRDNPEAHKTDDIKKSDKGRLVYGGGGITPDHVVAEAKLNAFEESLANSFGVFTYVHEKFLVTNPKIDPSFQVSEQMMADFKEYLRSPAPGPNLHFTDKDFADNQQYIDVKLRQEVLYSMNYLQEAARVALEIDPQVQKAIEFIPEAKALQDQKPRGIAATDQDSHSSTIGQAASR